MGSAGTKPVTEFRSDALAHLDPAVAEAWRFNYADLRQRMTERCNQERTFPRKLSISEVVSTEDLPYAQDFARYAAHRARDDQVEPVLGGYGDPMMLKLELDRPSVSTLNADTHLLLTPFTCLQPDVTQSDQGGFFGYLRPTLRDHYHTLQMLPGRIRTGLAVDGVGAKKVDNRTVKPTPEQVEAQRRALPEGAAAAAATPPL